MSEASLEELGMTIRSAGGHQVTDTLALPIAVADASSIRWRWMLQQESPVYFSATFTPAGGGAALELFPCQQLASHSSGPMSVSGPGSLELRWTVPSVHEGWWLSSSEALTLEYECRVVPSHELRRRARDVRLAVLKDLVTEEKQQAQALREQNASYEASLEELRAQMEVIQRHVAAQEAQAQQAESKAAELNRERLQLLEEAMRESRTELAALAQPEPALGAIPEGEE